MKSTNLKDLSDYLGLSQTTVSRALNGYPEVSETTRERVLEAARTLNYSPNSRARSLATGRSMMIGHILSMNIQHELLNPIFSDFIAGASQVYTQNGYDMMISIIPENSDEESFYKKLISRGAVDGIIIHSPQMSDSRIDMLNTLGIPYVVHGRASDIEDNYCWVDVNNKRAFHRATRFLLDLGHRRIALLNGLEYMDFAFRRRMGFLDALSEADIAADPALLLSDEMTEDYGYTSTARLLNSPEPPTAFLVASMISAIGVRRAILEAGLKLGKNISVITHDDDLSYLKNGAEVPIFTATRSSVQQAGQLCAETLIKHIASPAQKPTSHLLEAQLIVGDSTGPAPQ